MQPSTSSLDRSLRLRPLVLALAPWAALSASAAPAGHEVLYLYEGGAPADRTGAAVAAAGDVDGDGRPDFVFGAPLAPLPAQDGGPPVGSVQVISGASGRTLHVLRGTDAYDGFGYAVAGGGDLDGDGYDDVLVGSPAGTPDAGSVHAFSGRLGTLLWMRAGFATGDRYGHAVAGVGDLDGDGRPDLAVGAPHADENGWNSGRVELVSGATGALLRTHDGGAGDFLGMSVAGLDDLDGDGRAEYVVGAPFSDTGAFNAGSAYVLSGADGGVLFAFHGAGVGDQAGHRVCGAGDVDADGVGDVAFAAPGADEGHLDAGAVEVRSGADGTRLLLVGGGAPAAYLAAVAALGDLDRDGCDDLLVGIASASGAAGEECGAVRVLSGATGAVLFECQGTKTRDWFGAAVAGPGDLDGDGRVELLVGAPGHDDELRRPGRVEALRVTSF